MGRFGEIAHLAVGNIHFDSGLQTEHVANGAAGGCPWTHLEMGR